MQKDRLGHFFNADYAAMNLDFLKVFVDVAHAGSFAEAGRRHGIDPSLVSRRIGSLERELGLRLFHRTTRACSLTEGGAEFLLKIEPHIAAIEAAKTAGRERTERPRGTLRVTASTSFGNEYLVPRLPEFLAAYPELHLDLILTDERLNLVEERIDVAVRLGKLADSEHVAVRLFPVQFRIYAAPRLARALSRIEPGPDGFQSMGCLTYSDGKAGQRVRVRDESGAGFHATLRGRLSVSNASALKRCACLGLAPAFLPDWLVADELQSGALVDPFPKLRFGSRGAEAAYLLYPTSAHVPAKVRCFVEYLSNRQSPSAGS
jgi:DNA-binding transcriptional LysR family regulator